ncbi:MAG: Integral rane protein TerC [Cyanobacteria bacterium RYN_339]|nr:Integral rane protein TerC [Cyanobacteria bacterium RYN_339]
MEPTFWLALTNVVALNIVLSGDNAVVIAMAVRRLPPTLARKAALVGAVGAIGLRVAFTALAAVLLAVPLLQAVGGVVLFWVAAKLLAGDGEEGDGAAVEGFWPAVRLIVCADLVMSLDNILAVAGAAHGSMPLLLAGLAISIPLVLGGSAAIAGALKRWPVLNLAGAGLLAATAGRMIAEDPLVHAWLATPVASLAPLLGVALIALTHKRAQVA